MTSVNIQYVEVHAGGWWKVHTPVWNKGKHFNLLVVNNQPLSVAFNFQFSSIEDLLIDCNIQFSICLVPIMAWGFQHSIFCSLKNWLLNATFNFSVVVGEIWLLTTTFNYQFFWW